MPLNFNARLLVIDDDETIRDSFREILVPKRSSTHEEQALRAAGANLFDEEDAGPAPKRSSATFEFEFDEAANGKIGFDKVEKSLADQRPYAAIFVDMRMPGWDGLETVQHLRKIDKRAEIIFVTAYSDHSIEEIVKRVGSNVSYHCKPFAIEEIEQIATKAVYEWNKTRNLEELIHNISTLRARTWQMESLLSNILQQVSDLLGTDSALVARKSGDTFQKVLATGALLDDALAAKYLSTLPSDVSSNEVFQNDAFAYFTIDKYGILALFETCGRLLNNERVYLVRLFIEQAAMVIENVNLQEALIRQEKLSAIGQATSMIAHDMRNAMGGIEMAVNVITEEVGQSSSVLEMLELIRNRAQEGLDYVQDLLDFTSQATLSKKALSAGIVAAGMRYKTELFFGKSACQLEIRLDKDFVFKGEDKKIYRVLLNLVKNAFEVLRDNETPDPKIVLSADFQDGKGFFVVTDNGPGIPDKVKGNLFQPFVTCDKSGGTGLGLAIVKQFVEAHGGEITVSSQPGRTAFTIALPATAMA